jgi:tryptophan-rich sensory protein
MATSKGKSIQGSLTANVAVFVLVTLALNGVIFGLGWDRASTPSPGIPPGWIVGAIWVLLFAAMGVARWAMLRRPGRRWIAELPTLLGFLCLIYPLYTSGLSDDRVGLIGNVLTAAVAVPIALAAWWRSRVAGWCISAVCAWLVYAAAAVGDGLHR